MSSLISSSLAAAAVQVAGGKEITSTSSGLEASTWSQQLEINHLMHAEMPAAEKSRTTESEIVQLFIKKYIFVVMPVLWLDWYQSFGLILKQQAPEALPLKSQMCSH